MKIRILSYNIHKGFTIGNTDFVLDRIKHAVKEVDADILFLQEVQGHHSHEDWLIPDWETAVQFEYLADTLWPHYAYGKNAIYAEGHHGNAILSKFPIIDWSNISLNTNPLEQRGLLKAKILLPQTGQELLLMNTHLNLTQNGRNKQIRLIIDDINQLSNMPWLLVGDFNDWNKKLARQIQEEIGVMEAFNHLLGDYPATFPALMPVLSLDRVFFHGFDVISAQVLSESHWRRLSDHLPLLVELEIKPAN